MKRQVIKGYPWPEEKHSIAIRKAVIDDGMYLIVDFVSDKPQLRVCIGKKKYANYYPEGTSVTVQGKKHETYAVLPDSWDQKQIAKVIESDLLVKQAVSYDDGGTGGRKGKPVRMDWVKRTRLPTETDGTQTRDPKRPDSGVSGTGAGDPIRIY